MFFVLFTIDNENKKLYNMHDSYYFSFNFAQINTKEDTEILLSNITPFVRQAIIGSVGSNFSKADVFRHLQTPDHRLFYIINGTGTMKFSDSEYKLSPGNVILFQSGTEYIWNTEHVDIISINFDYTRNFSHITTTFHPIHSGRFLENSAFEKIVFEDAEVLNTPLCVENAFFTEQLLRAMSSAYYTKEKFATELLSTYIKSVITALVYEVYSRKAGSTKNSPDFTREIINYIQNNYKQNITNADISDIFHFNTSYVNRVFKQSTGSTIHKFLIDYRINIAKELLRTQNSSVYSIAREVGFSDPHHFIKYFKKVVGSTPTEYRKSNI